VKLYIVYDVNPRLLMKRLKDAGQPLVAIKFYGPALTKVPVACAGFQDSADDGVISGIMAQLGGQKPASALMDAREQQLRQEFEA